jgi:surface polysaccharide O-acyltransferase-like enzyme
MTHLQNLHRFRSLAIVCIVGAHTLFNFDWTGQHTVFALLHGLLHESSLWFAFIAGFLFQHLSKAFSYKNYLGKKALTVMLPYLIVSVPALLASVTIYNQGMAPGFETEPLWMKVWLLLATGKHLGPLWFVPAITFIYLLSPVFLWIDRKQWPYAILLILMPLSFWYGRDGLLIETGLNGNWAALSKAAYLIAPYMFGMACSRYHHKVMGYVQSARWPLAAVAGFCFFMATQSDPLMQMRGVFAFKIVTALLLLLVLKRREAAVLDRFEIGLVAKGVSPPLLAGSLLGFIVLTAATTAASLFTIYVVQKLFGQRCRYIVGAALPKPRKQNDVAATTVAVR